MSLLWTDRDWSKFTWVNRRVLPLAFEVNLAMGAVKGRLAALPDDLRTSARRGIFAEEIVFSAKIDRWPVSEVLVAGAVQNFGQVPALGRGKGDRNADALVKSAYVGLRFLSAPPSAEQIRCWHPDVERRDWNDPNVALIALRDDARLSPEEQAPFAALPSDQIAPELDYLARILKSAENSDCASLAACAHLWMAMMRPFVRANGIMARLVTQAVLHRMAEEVPVLVPLSFVLHEERAAYFERLGKAAWDGRDITEFVIWHHRMMLRAARRALEHVKRAEVKQRVGVTMQPLPPVQRDLLRVLIERSAEGVNIGELVAETGKSRSWLFRQMQGLMRQGIVRGEGPDKLRTYVLTPDWQVRARPSPVADSRG